MSVLITGSSIRTCFGNGKRTFTALLRGESGVSPLPHTNGSALNVTHGYSISEDDKEEELFRASRWLASCAREALEQSGVDATQQNLFALVGTGLRELRAVERVALEQVEIAADQLHFRGAIRQAVPDVADVITLSNACSAGGHALALAQDLLEQGEADAVLVAATDSMTHSMLAMIGRFSDHCTDQVRPFDLQSTGVLLGEGAAALVLIREDSSNTHLARLLSTGLACDASHETAPDPKGIRRAMVNALELAQRRPEEVDLIVAHGTGTALNDPTEAEAIRSVFGASGKGPWITALKGAIGHTSGGAALMGVDVAIRSLAAGLVPPIVGLREPLTDGKSQQFVIGKPVCARLRLASINAFGFGGVNSVTLVEGIQ